MKLLKDTKFTQTGGVIASDIAASCVNLVPGSVVQFLDLAQRAYDAGNDREAEDYCTKVLAKDENCYPAWLIKGKAICRQSEYSRERIMEGAMAMCAGIRCTPAEKKEEVTEQALRHVRLICGDLCALAKGNFSDACLEEHMDKFFEFHKVCAQATDLLIGVPDKTQQ